MKKFKNSITMKVTQRQFDLDLKGKLLKLGYEDDRPWNSINNPKVKSKFCYLNVCDSQWFFHNHDCETTSHVIENYNPELFLALAAMTEGEDWIVGEWLKYKDLITWATEPIFKVKRLEGCNDFIGYAGNEYKKYFEKATKEEIIIHFTKEEMNTATKEEERFPFQLKEQDAKRIINITCGEWQQKLAKMWGYELLIYGNVEITEDFYKEMRNACTPSQNLLFDEIFGEDEKGLSGW